METISTLKREIDQLRELHHQSSTVTENAASAAAELDSLRPRIDAAEKLIKEAEARAIRDIAAPGEVANARSALDALLQRGRELAGLQAAAVRAIRSLDRERMVKQSEVTSARNAYCNQAFDAIAAEIATDRKLRARVLEAYSLTAFQADGGLVRWTGILESLIGAPTDDEIPPAMAAAAKKYGFASEADHGAA